MPNEKGAKPADPPLAKVQGPCPICGREDLWTAIRKHVTKSKAREPRVYYAPETKTNKAHIVFDAGYQGGDVHIYEHVKTLGAMQLSQALKEIGENSASWILVEG